MGETHNRIPLTGTNGTNTLDNYTIAGDVYGYKGMLDGLLASDKGYSQLMGYFGEAGTGTELKFNITDLGAGANTPVTFNATTKTIQLDNSLFDMDLEVVKLGADLNLDGTINELDQNIYIQNLTTEAMLGVSGLTGTTLETLRNDLATDDTPSPYFPLESNQPEQKSSDNATENHAEEAEEEEEEEAEAEAAEEEEAESSSVSHNSSHTDTESESTMGHSEGASDVSDVLHAAYDVVGTAINIDIEKKMQALYNKHSANIKEAQGKDSDTKEKAYNALTKDFQILAADIVQKLSDAIDNSEGDKQKKLLNAAATWIKYGLHSAAENGENGNEMHGIHHLEHGTPEEQRAFQIAHMMNAGNDTKIGDTYRKKNDTTDALKRLDGAALSALMGDDGTLADLFTSNKDFVGGKEVADPDGTKISTGWGASGDARMSAQSEWKMGARQNIWSTNMAFNTINT